MSGVLIIGSGGREHAIAWKLAQTVEKVKIAPGNGSPFQSEKDLDIDNADDIVAYCKKENIDMVVIGPEVPLSKGIVDRLQGKINVFGPTAAGAMLETSKIFSKQFMTEINLPTARFAEFHENSDAQTFIENCDWSGIVVKADGLAAGKGVVVANNKIEASEAAEHMLAGEFGASSAKILLEERLDGYEVSALCFTDGTSFSRMPLIRDHKRLLEGDKGPNTGGMGVVGPVSVPSDVNEQIDKILQDTIDGLRSKGIVYKGVIYAGLMVTKAGPLLLEFNCRFGDPETEIIMRLLDSDLRKILNSCVNGTLSQQNIQWKKSHACGIILSSKDYPYKSDKGTPIHNIPADTDSTVVFHAGTSLQENQVVTAGGRILCVTALGSTDDEARNSAIKGAEEVQFEGKFFRRDIGKTLSTGPSHSLSYGDSGVDINEGNQFVEDIKKHVKSTLKAGTGQIGGFGALVDFKAAGYSNASQIVVGIDGVGTKIEVADHMNDYSGIGYDVVGMCVNDVLCHNAAPIAFLDYFVCGKLDRQRAATVVKSISKACIESNCSLVGGETAEMPGVYGPEQWDLAGCAIAVRDPNWPELPNAKSMKEGDIILALNSSGVHSNGFSLVRKIFSVNKIDYKTPTPWNKDRTFGEVLLAPTRLYVKQMLSIMKEGLVKGVAHITGGGISENATRVLDKDGDLAMHVDASSWPKQDIFQWMACMGPVQPKEMFRTFNSGIGMVMVVSKEKVAEVKSRLEAVGEKVHTIGNIVKRTGEELISFTNLETAYDYSLYQPNRRKVKVGILISGAGSNMAKLIERAQRPGSNSEVVVVISNKSSAKGLDIANSFGVKTAVIPHTKERNQGDANMTKLLKEQGVQLICLAGFMRILSTEFVSEWSGKIINVHPSLLPAFRGGHAVRDALAAGVKVAGCSVHYTVEEVDAGGIIAQEVVKVSPNDTEETLHEKIKVKEHIVFPDAMELVAEKILSSQNA